MQLIRTLLGPVDYLFQGGASHFEFVLREEVMLKLVKPVCIEEAHQLGLVTVVPPARRRHRSARTRASLDGEEQP